MVIDWSWSYCTNMSGGFERWNTHFSTEVEQECLGINFKLAQDPNSHNLGTTVWDASIVLAKWLEKNAKRGDFSRQRAKGRRCLELGSGMGLGGLAFALLGADVTLTDLAPVLPLLARNYQHNLSPAVLRVGDASWAVGMVGKVDVQELDWSRPEQYAHFSPPYDYILAADCVYSELAVPSFLATVLHMSDSKTSVVIVNEFRSQSVHDTFMGAFTQHFTLKKIPPSKMDPLYQHPLIHIYVCKRKKAGAAAGGATKEEQQPGEQERQGERQHEHQEQQSHPSGLSAGGPVVAAALRHGDLGGYSSDDACTAGAEAARVQEGQSSLPSAAGRPGAEDPECMCWAQVRAGTQGETEAEAALQQLGELRLQTDVAGDQSGGSCSGGGSMTARPGDPLCSCGQLACSSSNRQCNSFAAH